MGYLIGGTIIAFMFYHVGKYEAEIEWKRREDAAMAKIRRQVYKLLKACHAKFDR